MRYNLKHNKCFPLLLNCRLRQLVEWMNEQPFSSAARQPCGTLAVDESIVAEIAKVVDEQKRESTRQTVYKIHVKPHLVFLKYFFINSFLLVQN